MPEENSNAFYFTDICCLLFAGSPDYILHRIEKAPEIAKLFPADCQPWFLCVGRTEICVPPDAVHCSQLDVRPGGDPVQRKSGSGKMDHIFYGRIQSEYSLRVQISDIHNRQHQPVSGYGFHRIEDCASHRDFLLHFPRDFLCHRYLQRQGRGAENLFHVGLYIVFFPQLVAGPILRYSVIADQIMGRKETFEEFSRGVCRFLKGFAKKILLANNFALIADTAFSLHNSELSVSFAWLGAVAYTLQIYFDFSGYSDMAIGLGKMFGFHFPENFNYPYISKSTSEFWRRWHISLGTWFRDYVYIPLGGSRVESGGRLIFNLFVVWSLTGFWHGASWTFICWGLLYFVSISLEKITDFEHLGAGITAAAAAKHVYTMLLVVFGWVLFRAETIGAAAGYLKTMLFLNGAQFLDGNTVVFLAENKVFLVLGILFSMPVSKAFSKWFEGKKNAGNPILTGTATVVYPSVMLLLFLIAMSYIVKGSYNPFIYFNF